MALRNANALIDALSGLMFALSFVGWLVVLCSCWVSWLVVRGIWRHLISPYEYVKVKEGSGAKGCLTIVVVVGLAVLLGLKEQVT